MTEITVSFYLKQKLKKMTSSEAKKFLLAEWYKQMYPYIPFQNGIMANNISIEDDGIHFKGPQARYLYYGMLMVSPTTGSAWAKKGETKVPTSTPLHYSHEQHPLACAEWGKVVTHLKGDTIVQEFKKYILSKK